MPDLLKILFMAILVAARFTLNCCEESSYHPISPAEDEMEKQEEINKHYAAVNSRVKQLLSDLYWENLQRTVPENFNMPEYYLEDGTRLEDGDGLEEEKRFSEFLGGRRRRVNDFLGGKRKRFSEFLGGKKRFSEFLGGKKRVTDFH